MKKGSIIIGFIASALLIYLIIWIPEIRGFISGDIGIGKALFGKPRIEFNELWNTLKSVNLFFLIGAILTTPCHVLVRSHRWSLMIRPLGKLRTRDGFSINMVGYMANTILPLRIGELLRGILVANHSKLNPATGIATVILDRIIDGFSLLFVLLLVGLAYPYPESVKTAVKMLSVLIGIIFVLLLYFATVKDPANGWIGKLLSIFPEKISNRLKKLLERFISGFNILRNGRKYSIPIIFESAVIWVIYALQVYLCVLAFGFHEQYPLIAENPVMASLVVLVVCAIVLSIPSAPGGVGTFHAAAMIALSLFGVPSDPAAGFALVLHAITIAVYILLGIPLMWHEGLNFTRIRSIKKPAFDS